MKRFVTFSGDVDSLLSVMQTSSGICVTCLPDAERYAITETFTRAGYDIKAQKIIGLDAQWSKQLYKWIGTVLKRLHECNEFDLLAKIIKILLHKHRRLKISKLYKLIELDHTRINSLPGNIITY